jgi:SAM-dependent methyltransferase
LPVSPDARARSFGAAAADYELGRAGWPDRVAEVAELPPSAKVLDLAAGTGKLTRLLARHFARVVAVEPDAALRALIPAGEALPGEAEAIPLPDASVDGVFVAEAFHWFDAAAAVREIARVLRPGGALVVCFNGQAGETEPSWPEAAREVVRRHLPPMPEVGGRHLVEAGTWREPFAGSAFEELRYEEVAHQHVHGTDEEIAALLSISGFALLSQEEREALRRELRAVLPETTWRVPLKAEVYWTRLAA